MKKLGTRKTVGGGGMENRKSRRVSWRSHRKVRHILFAFGLASGSLGLVLIAGYVYRRQGVMLWLGGLYVLTSLFLFGLRGILGHLDDMNRVRRFGDRRKGVA